MMFGKLKYGPYSPSRLDTANCPFSFYHQYVVKKEGKGSKVSSLAQDRGSAIHLVLERITHRMREDKNATFSSEELREWTTDAVRQHPAAYQETGLILDMARRYIMKPPPVLTPDAETELRLAVRWDDGEKGFVECLYDDPRAVARGRADIWMISDDTTFGLCYDHKSQPNIEAADTFQQGFYAWVLGRINPFLSEIRSVLHFTRYGCYSDPHIWTKEELARVEDEVVTRIQIIESRDGDRPEDWPAIPNKHCQYCNYLGDCPAMKEFIEVLPTGDYRVLPNNLHVLGDTNKAVKLAGFIHASEEAIGVAKSSLKQHVDISGPIAIPGIVYDYYSSEKIDWDKCNTKGRRKDLYAIFEKYGVDPRDFMSFNETASKAVWVCKSEALVKELSDFLPHKVETKFQGKKM
jgi:hypothetical protein